MKIIDIYALGYAVPTYDIVKSVRHWRWWDKCITLPYNAVPTWHLQGMEFEVAKIEDVRRRSHA